MSVFLSPGVFTKEIDLSLYIPNLSTTAFGVVGLCSKGPINQPMYVTDPVQFSTIFGDPANPNLEFQPAVYSSLQYLSTGRQLWFVRVAEFDPGDPDGTITGSIYMAKFGKVTIPQHSAVPKIMGSINSLVTLTSSNNTLTFNVDEASPGFNVVFSVGSGSVTLSIPQVVAILNANTTFAAYMKATLSPTGTLVISGLVPGSAHSLQISGTNLGTNSFGFPVEGTSTPVAFGVGNTAENAFILGSDATFPATLVTGVNDTLTFKTGVDAGAETTVSYTFAAGTFQLNDIVNALNINGTFNANLIAAGFSGQLRVSVKPASSFKYLALGGTPGTSPDCSFDCFGIINGENYVLGDPTFPITITTGENDTINFVKNNFTTPLDTPVSVTLPAGTIADASTLQIILGSNGSDALPAGLDSAVVTIDSIDYVMITLHSGSTYQGLTLDTTADGTESVFGEQPDQKKDATVADNTLSITSLTQGTWANNLSIAIVPNLVNGEEVSFNLLVYEKSFLVESYRNLVVEPLLIPDPLHAGSNIANPFFVENAINGISTRITVTNATDNIDFPLASGVNNNYTLSGGSNGSDPYTSGAIADTISTPDTGTTDPSIFIGFSDGLQTTGMQFFTNPELLDINLIAVPGISDPAVINEMITICQSRGDCMCLVDPPLGYTPQQVTDWVNGAGVFAGDHAAFNSSYAACYWPWLQIYDPINAMTVFTPPAGHIANVYAYTDLVSDPWIAPAGLTRGRLTTPLKAEYTPTTGERDLLYESNINPIATFVSDGINVFGQKTLQRAPTALDRVNVRRLLLYLEKVITTASRYLLFEPDDITTWLAFVNLVEPFMAAVKSRRGVTDYQVRCDATTNTPETVENSEMVALIFIKPTKAAEFIQISFVLTAQNAVFSELSF